MGRRAIDDGGPDDTIWKGKKLYFKKRYPVEVTKLRPGWPKFFECSLKTGDVAQAKVRAAACLLDFHKKCGEALTLQAPETHEAWLRGLTPEQRAQVIAIGDAKSASTRGGLGNSDSPITGFRA